MDNRSDELRSRIFRSARLLHFPRVEIEARPPEPQTPELTVIGINHGPTRHRRVPYRRLDCFLSRACTPNFRTEHFAQNVQSLGDVNCSRDRQTMHAGRHGGPQRVVITECFHIGGQQEINDVLGPCRPDCVDYRQNERDLSSSLELVELDTQGIGFDMDLAHETRDAPRARSSPRRIGRLEPFEVGQEELLEKKRDDHATQQQRRRPCRR